MAETTIGSWRAGGRTPADAGRPLRRRRTLPGGRAVVGGFLVALAGVGTFAGYTSATSADHREYLVARTDLALGHRISRSDLAYVAMDVPGVVARRSFTDPRALLGAVVIGPVARGELVQASDVLGRPGPAAGAGAGREVSFAVESARAVDGRLRPGEFVDVLATYGTGRDAFTTVVLRGARVLDRHEPRGSLGDRRNEIVTLGVATREQAVALAHAVTAGVVTLVRGAAPGDGEAGAAGAAGADEPPYRTPSPDASPEGPAGGGAGDEGATTPAGQAPPPAPGG